MKINEFIIIIIKSVKVSDEKSDILFSLFDFLFIRTTKRQKYFPKPKWQLKNTDSLAPLNKPRIPPGHAEIKDG